MPETASDKDLAVYWRGIASKLIYGLHKIKHYKFIVRGMSSYRFNIEKLKALATTTLETAKSTAIEREDTDIWTNREREARLEAFLEGYGIQLQGDLASDIFFCASFEEFETKVGKLVKLKGDSDGDQKLLIKLSKEAKNDKVVDAISTKMA